MRPFYLYHNAIRAKEILATLARHGFDDFVSKLNLPSNWFTRFVGADTKGRSPWERIRLVCEDLGPTFIKFAQIISARPDVLPNGLIFELKKLRNHVPPEPFEDMEAVLVSGLGASIEETFVEFDREAFAGGSLAQVHRAVLKRPRREVVVKIQRPDIRKAIEADLDILGWIVSRAHANLKELRAYDLPSVLKETRQGILRELDFTLEAGNATIFNQLNPHPELVFAPKVFDDYCSQRVLVAERVTGSTPEAYGGDRESRKVLAKAGGDSIFHQIIIAGFFHADPHSGNLLITPNGRICFLDWGLVGQLTRRMRYFLTDLLAAIRSQDSEKVVRVAMRMFQGNHRVDTLAMEKQVMSALSRRSDLRMTGEAIGDLVMEMIFIFGSNGIHIARDYTALARAVVNIEEVARTLDPEYDLLKEAAPYVDELTIERFHPLTLLRQGGAFLTTSFGKLSELPNDVQRILRRIEDNELRVNLAHSGAEDLQDALDSAANRMSLAFIIGALVVGSSIITATGAGPQIFGYPAIGIIGYLISGLLGLWIVIDILRHSRHK